MVGSWYIEYKFGGSIEDVEGRHNEMAQLIEKQILGPAGMRRTMASQWQREKGASLELFVFGDE